MERRKELEKFVNKIHRKNNDVMMYYLKGEWKTKEELIEIGVAKESDQMIHLLYGTEVSGFKSGDFEFKYDPDGTEENN